eukprot:SM000287S10625  [mRNA]  locus=s287:33399:34256:+ [translate_table: standard]
MPAGRRQSAGGGRGRQGPLALPLVRARSSQLSRNCGASLAAADGGDVPCNARPHAAAAPSRHPVAANVINAHGLNVIATEATNILIRHFYQMAEHKQHRPKRVASETFPAGEQEPKLLRRSSSALPTVGEQPLQEEEGAT